jgi:hypothetical protein
VFELLCAVDLPDRCAEMTCPRQTAMCDAGLNCEACSRARQREDVQEPIARPRTARAMLMGDSVGMQRGRGKGEAPARGGRGPVELEHDGRIARSGRACENRDGWNMSGTIEPAKLGAGSLQWLDRTLSGLGRERNIP